MRSATYRHVTGDDALIKAFRALSDDMREQILREGMKELVKPIEIAAKRFARRSRDTGALEASITSKVANYPRSGKAVGLVGPDRNYYSKGKRVRGRLTALLARNQRKPANYAHLIEYGHVAVAPKKGTTRRKGTAQDVGFVAPRPFIRPAVATTQAQQAEGFYRGIERGWNKAVEKQVSSGRHVRKG